MMNSLLRDLINTGKVLVYMDDIIIFMNNLDEHRKLVRQVLQILRENKLYLKLKKCEFEKTRIEYLGLIISENSVEVDPIKIKGIQEWPTPTRKKELQQFLGFCNFYRRFIEDYSLVAKPLTKLTGNVPWKWENEQERAFNGLKLLLTTAPVLRMPNDFG